MVEAKLIWVTPYEVMMRAARKSHRSQQRLDTTLNKLGTHDHRLLRVLVKMGHHSVLEHIIYTFEIKNISRALLQQLARHRLISMTVESTRFALKKLLKTDNVYELIVPPCSNPDDSEELDAWNYKDVVESAAQALKNIKDRANELPNDILKYMLPESLKTELVMTVNARELAHIIHLRSRKDAMCEFQRLAKKLYKAVKTVHPELWEVLKEHFQYPDSLED